MFLSKLFTPKWQHKNPNVRKHALLSLSNKTSDRQAIYVAVALDDEESSIRRIAVQRLRDLELLARIARDDKDHNVCSDAEQRMAVILSGKLKSGPSLDERNEKIKSITDESILNYLLKNAVESSIRLSIAERFDQQSVYAEVAITDSDNDVQMAALKHISQKAILERVAKQTRRKNKVLSQAAQSRVDKIREQNENVQKLRQEAKLLCAEVNGLTNSAREHQTWTDAQNAIERISTRWAKLDSDWRSLSGAIDDELQVKFDKACSAFNDEKKDYEEGQAKRQARNEKYLPIQQEKRALCDTLEIELNNIHQVKSLSNAEIDKLESLLATSKSSWQTLSNKLIEPLDQYDEALDKALNDQYKQLLDKAQVYKKDIELYLKSIKFARDLSHQIRQLSRKSGHIKKTDINKLQEKWAKLSKPTYFKLNETDSIDIDAQLNELLSKYESQEESRKHDKAEFLKVVRSLKDTVAEGKAAHANKLVKQGSNLLRKLAADDVKEFREAGSLQQFQSLQQEVNELQDWRKWSNEPKKIQLCQSVENLVAKLEETPELTTLNFEDIADQVRSAREEWKNLSKSEVNASVELWERFDAACKSAYEPCQEYFGEESKKRDENLAQKEALCDSLEDYIKVVAAKANEDIDWRAVDKIVRVASQDWGKLGPVNHRDKKASDGRFYSALNKLNKLNREERQRNSDKKTLIIKQAEKIATDLVDERTSLNEAIDTVKKLQVEWKTIGVAMKDAMLWKKFRKPCDEIFALRASKIEQEKQVQETIINERKVICENIESLGHLSAEEVLSKRSEFEEMSKQWASYEKLPKHDALEKRYKNAVQSFNKQIENARLERDKALKQQQQVQVSMCWQAEDFVRNLCNNEHNISQFEMDYASLKQEWDALELKQDALSKAIAERFQSAVQLIEDLKSGDNITLREKLEESSKIAKETKLTLCLQLEIAANVESPQEYKHDRMAYQVSVLANKMQRDALTDIESEVDDLVRRWHKAGLVIDKDANAMENRFFDTYNKNL